MHALNKLAQLCASPLQQPPPADWQKGYEAGARVRARIIYVDPVSKRVSLSLLPHLVAGSASPALPPINTLFEVLTPFFLDIPAGLQQRLVARGP